MLTRTARLAMATASVWFAFGVGGSGEASPILLAPSGLSPGDSFRFAFITDGTTAATSTDISTYNTFVNTQADGATYDGMTITWYAIASTSATDAAFSNIGEDNVPVYLASGEEVASSDTASSGGLWSGGFGNLARSTTISQAVLLVASTFGRERCPAELVTTRSVSADRHPRIVLVAHNSSWIDTAVPPPPHSDATPFEVYGHPSQASTVPLGVPEPSSLLLVATGIGTIFVVTLRRKSANQER